MTIQHIRTSRLLKHCDPFAFELWSAAGLIVLKNITDCLNNAEEELRSNQMDCSRVDHIKTIAWFVRNGFQQPIEIDVGIPILYYYNDWIINDSLREFRC